MDELFTRDGETAFEPVYDIPEDPEPDTSVHLLPADADEGARSTSVDFETFEEEFSEFDPNEKTDAYLRERGRNGFGIQ